MSFSTRLHPTIQRLLRTPAFAAVISAATAAAIATAVMPSQQPGLYVFPLTLSLALSPLFAFLAGLRAGIASLAAQLVVMLVFFAFPTMRPPAEMTVPTSLVAITTVVMTLALVLLGGWYQRRIDRLLADARELANRDALTGVSNRRHGQERLELEVARAQRLGRPLSVILFDIDYFKRINDTFGHRTGDAVLRELTDLASTILRSYDTLARWGGEEFLVIAPDTNLSDAVAMAERLRQRVADQHFAHRFAHQVPITLSLGVAALGSDDDVDSLISRADDLLYRAKRLGRNRVVANPEDSPTNTHTGNASGNASGNPSGNASKNALPDRRLNATAW